MQASKPLPAPSHTSRSLATRGGRRSNRLDVTHDASPFSPAALRRTRRPHAAAPLETGRDARAPAIKAMDTNMEDVGRAPADLSPVQTEPASIPTLDGWIENLMDCKQLSENDVQRLCDKVSPPPRATGSPRNSLPMQMGISVMGGARPLQN